MKRTYPLIILLLLCVVTPALQSGPQDTDTARFISGRTHEKVLRYLRSGDAEERIYAAEFIGMQREIRYLRELGEELNHDLDVDSSYVGMNHNDPYVKSKIAWALGRLQHKKAVPYLLDALGKTYEIIKRRHEESQKKQRIAAENFSAGKNSKSATINGEPTAEIEFYKDRPGPFLQSTDHAFQYSPDIYWSISDEFKSVVSPDMSNPGHRMRFRGYNYVNLYFYIISAIADTYNVEKHKENVPDEHVQKLLEYLKPDKYPFIRSATAVSLGRIGSPFAKSQVLQHYDKESDEEVKARTAYAILEIDPTQTKYFDALIGFLQSRKNSVRFAAVTVLEELNFGEALPYLKEAVVIENHPMIRDVMKRAISKITRMYFSTP